MSNDHDGSARKRPRENSSGLPPLLSAWECDPDYGIVHLSGCPICHKYMHHLSEASHSENQPSFQMALRDRDNKRDVYYFDGVREGRIRQRKDDEPLFDDLENLRAERKEAIETLGRYRIQCNDAREELGLVKERLRASQAECERLRQRVEVMSREKLDLTNRAINQEVQEVERMLLDSEGSPHSTDVQTTKTKQVSNPISISSSPGQSQSRSPKSESKSPKLPTSVGSPSSLAAEYPSSNASSSQTTYAAAASSQLPAPSKSNTTIMHASSISAAALRSVANLPARPGQFPSISANVDLRATTAHTSSQPTMPGRAGNPKNLRQLQALMSAAHQPGNERALAKVKALCAEAHQTPREQKTEMQRFLLANWRNPSAAGEGLTHPLPPPPSVVKTNPRMDDPVQVWYEYLCAHQGSWPRGVRRDSRGRPNLSDLKASRTVARLRPEVEPNGNTSFRSDFMLQVTRLFATPGAYEGNLERNGLRVSPMVTYQSYEGPFNVTLEDIARHFADCGITSTVAAQELEPWAREYQASVVATDQMGASSADYRRVTPGQGTSGYPSAFGGYPSDRLA